MGLSGHGHRMPNELSGGMRKRAGFARALVLEPEIVMFDEPDSGLDPVRTSLLCDVIQSVHAQHGGSYILITHDIATARRIGEYVALLWKGRIVESGDRDEIFNSENPFVRQFLAGSSAGPLAMD
jgi:phospholipid/cholesterol/gamma-HCH transport system ATP-binding protein